MRCHCRFDLVETSEVDPFRTEHQTGHEPPRACGLLAFLPWGPSWATRAASTPTNGDNVVNDADAAILAAHWGEGTGEARVPEPGSLALLAGMAVMGMVYLRRRKA
jgi:hypothetical protein